MSVQAINPTDRFSNRVENYLRFRPTYPREIIGLMQTEMDLNGNSVVADIGSGTGIFTKLLLEANCAIFGIEPNAAMREAGENFLRHCANFKSVNGTAENTNLPTESVDLITTAQAFHWFDIAKTKAEFNRILRNNGHVALIWNVRQPDADAFSIDYEHLLQAFGTDYKQVIDRHEPLAILTKFFDQSFQTKVYQHQQIFDFESLQGRLLSSSYIPTEESDRFLPMIAQLESVFAKHQNAGTVKFYYDTKVYYKIIKQ